MRPRNNGIQAWGEEANQAAIAVWPLAIVVSIVHIIYRVELRMAPNLE